MPPKTEPKPTGKFESREHEYLHAILLELRSQRRIINDIKHSLTFIIIVILLSVVGCVALSLFGFFSASGMLF